MRLSIHYLLCIIGSFLLFSGLYAQSELAEPFAPIFEPFEIPGGIFANKVQTMAQDANGFLWFGSEGGLHRYDGHHFKTYLHDPEDSTSLSSNYIEQILVGPGWRCMGWNT